MKFTYEMPTKLHFGAGTLSRLSREKLPTGKALIVTGGNSTTRLGYVDRVQELLEKAGHDSVVYAGVQPNPTVENVRKATAIAKEQKCTFVVGIGGGSSLDCAKAVSVMATNAGDWWDYIAGGSGLGKVFTEKPLPMVAITTTAGTGTEADPWTVISNGAEKIGNSSLCKVFPAVSIVDPDLMMTVPADLTAYQGFDALFHAVEGYISKAANPMSEMFSLQAIAMIGEHLPTAVKEATNKEARSYVALANTYAGFVESLSSCTSEHSIEHALSGFHPKLPHGAGLIMISVAYFTYFNKVCPERLLTMAHALGRADGDFVGALVDLQQACGVDKLHMSDYGILPNLFAEYAKHAFADMGALFACDRTVLTEADIIAMLTESYT